MQQKFRIIEAERQRARTNLELTKDYQEKKLRQLKKESSELDKNLKLATSKVTRQYFLLFLPVILDHEGKRWGVFGRN